MEPKLSSQSQNLEDKIALLERRLIREKKARIEAEGLLETKSIELFDANTKLGSLNRSLEKNIRRRTQTLTTLIDSLYSGVLLNDENGEIIFTNQKFREIFKINLSSGELVGFDQRKASSMVKHLFKKPEKFISIVEKCLETNSDVFNYELEMINGRIYDCDFISITSEDEFVGNLWQIREVTNERLTQKKIADSEEKYRGIIENMELGLLEVDKEHRILRAYDSFCEMIGYEEEELLGKNAMETFLPHDYHEAMQFEDEKRKEGQQGVYETRLIKKNGEIIWVIISGAPFYDENGEMVGSIGIHYDISERKNLEGQLEQAKNQAEKSREAEKQFLANMSHEIRNPINAIIGMTSLLYDTPMTAQQLEYLGNIKFSSDILLGLISGILDISKIESGKFELVESNFDLNDTLSALIEIANFRSEDKDVNISLRLDDDINFKVKADITVLNQIFLNLLNNALKFTEKGEILISGVLIERDEKEAHFVFAVKDGGIGIPSDKLDQIFELFNQGDTATKLRYGGTGLGLAIVKQLVEKYQGNVSVESEVGVGSTFQFDMRLPITNEASDNKREYSIHAKSGHVLIVEDNFINQKYLSGILRNWGLTFDIANNGQEALDWLQKEKYDAVLMDIRMPVMDGYEATIRIRADHSNENADVPIIALTASALVDEKENALEVGMNYHLTKPFTPDQLANVFRQFNLIEIVELAQSNNFKFSDDLDVPYLNEFYLQDLDRAQVMFEIFLSTIDREMNDLQEALSSEDWQKFVTIAHKIKPNFSMVGLTDLTGILKDYEKATKDVELREKIKQNFDFTIRKFEKGKKIVENESAKMNQFLKP